MNRSSISLYLDDLLKQGGVKSEKELANFLIAKITKGFVNELELAAPEFGCAAFTATTTGGDALFARNYDFYETNTCIVRTHARKGRHATISTTDLSFAGKQLKDGIRGIADKVLCLTAPYITLDGLNDAGVSCCINMSYQGGGEGGVVQDEWEAMNLLGQIARRTWKPVRNAYTPHSVVYNLTDKSVLWVSNENYEDETAIFEFRVK